MTRLDGHVSVVTGGNRGIGLGLAEGLVQAGASVAVWARDERRTAEACAHLELARHRVRCNAILPGWTETEMLEPGRSNERWVDATVRRTPVRRWGVPADFRSVAAYLADPSLSFHTGDSVVVDGGYVLIPSPAPTVG